MYSQRYLLAIVLLLSFTSRLHAVSLPLQNLDSPQLDKVIGDISANFLHTTVSGAGTLGQDFGFEIGLIGGETHTPDLQTLVASYGGSASEVPDAQAIAVLTVPLGITAEIGILPKVGTADFKTSNYSLAAKWTPTQLFGDFPVDLAGKLSVTQTTANFSASIGSTPTDFAYTSMQTALTALVSKDFAIVTPYFGLGTAKANGQLVASNPTAVFQPAFTSGASATGKASTVFWLAGLEVKLLAVKLGAEYTSAYNSSRIVGKLSLFF